MNETIKIKFADLKRLTGEYLKTALGVDQFSIIFAKLDGGNWKVNVEFKETVNDIIWPTVALFTLDGETGEVKEFQKGRQWAF